MGRVVLLTHRLSKARLLVLHSVTFIDDNVLPDELGKDSLIVHDVLVSRDEDIELLTVNDLGQQGSLRFLTLVNDNFDIWRPLLELQGPIGYRRQRNDDQEWPIVVLDLDEMRKKSDGLNGFTKTHFICQNTVQIIIIQ